MQSRYKLFFIYLAFYHAAVSEINYLKQTSIGEKLKSILKISSEGLRKKDDNGKYM